MKILKTPQNITMEIREIDKYKIKDVKNIHRRDDKTLYVVKPWEMLNIEPKKIIYYLDGRPSLKIN
jgi:hypothetical protein